MLCPGDQTCYEICWLRTEKAKIITESEYQLLKKDQRILETLRSYNFEAYEDAVATLETVV
jgi:hypothetical protein